MLMLISGTLVGSADFSEIYIDPGDKDKVNSCSEKDHTKSKGEDNNKKKGTNPASNSTKSGKTPKDATG
jgi:hypothetical protein